MRSSTLFESDLNISRFSRVSESALGKINQHEQDFEDWDFFADDSDNRVWLNCFPLAFVYYSSTNPSTVNRM